MCVRVDFAGAGHMFDTWKIRRWLTIIWYQYLFEQPWHDKLTFRMIVCRIKGHPNGEVFYNAGGLEPDHSCKDCGEDIG